MNGRVIWTLRAIAVVLNLLVLAALIQVAVERGVSLLQPVTPVNHQPAFWGRLLIVSVVLVHPILNIWLILWQGTESKKSN